MELQKPVTGVALDLSQIRIVVCDVQDKPGTAAYLFDRLAKRNISVDMIIQSYARTGQKTNDIAFTVGREDEEKVLTVIKKVKNELGYSNIFIDGDIAKVSIVGAGMIDYPGIAAKMFNTLAELSINIKMISTSEIKISCVVDRERAEEAISGLHTVFGLNSRERAEVKGTLPNV